MLGWLILVKADDTKLKPFYQSAKKRKKRKARKAKAGRLGEQPPIFACAHIPCALPVLYIVVLDSNTVHVQDRGVIEASR